MTNLAETLTPAPFSAALPPVIVTAPEQSAPALTVSQSGGPLQVRRIGSRIGRRSTSCTPPEWLALAAQWNRLAGTIPFRRFEWLEAWWRHYGQPGWELMLLAIEDAAGQLVGLAPWYLAGGGIDGRVVQMLGSGEVCSEYQTILSVPGREVDVAGAVAEWLDTEAAGDWDLLLLSAVTKADSAVEALADEFARRGYAIHQRSGMPCWRTELAGTWDGFIRGLSSSRRARVRQLTRKYFDSGRITVHQATDCQSLEEGYRILVDLHQRRRQALGQAGCFAAPRFAGFHAEICRKFQAQGVLRLLWTELDGRPVAVEYAFTGGQTVYYYQTGLDPAARADDPGWLGMIGSLQRAIGEGYRWFDFLRGEETYKTSWGAEPQPLVETRIVPRNTLARLRHSAWLMRQQVHAWARQHFLRANSPKCRGEAVAAPTPALPASPSPPVPSP